MGLAPIHDPLHVVLNILKGRKYVMAYEDDDGVFHGFISDVLDGQEALWLSSIVDEAVRRRNSPDED